MAQKSVPPARREGLEGRLYAGVAVLVAGLAALVWWSLPGDNPPVVTINVEAGAVPATIDTPPEAGMKNVTRPLRAVAELAVLTTRPEREAETAARPSEIAKRLEARHCGPAPACDAIKKLLEDEDNVTLEVRSAEDVILPGVETYDTTALTLTPDERRSLPDRKNAVVIRIEGNVSNDHLVARAIFAIGSLLAEELDGVSWDETARRFQTKRELSALAITTPLGESGFVPRHVLVQLLRQEDGTVRLVSLGLQRFGAPDLSLRGANMSAAPPLSHVLNAAAAQIVAGAPLDTVTVTLADVARVLGKKPAELNKSPDDSRPVKLDVVRPPPDGDDPDNEVGELVPPGGSTREAWDAVRASLFGAAAAPSTPSNDDDAKQELPEAIRRFDRGEGLLYVKGPFGIPDEARVDGGAGTEQLWIEVASCNAEQCLGMPSNEPSFATNLAPGKTTSVKRAEATDWLLQQRDGGVARPRAK
ncbi:MAG: DUF2314 domain-containing protein [Labilithrix sp.]|nr:DUF2314 domain-containing protein [Labilithrix sp.]MCW5815388.1 DUF2314 domain-containing protein [Labilithrix sp.]